MTSRVLEDLATILIPESAIQKRVRVLGAEITAAYAEAGELTVVAIINGAIPFTADLIRTINLPLRLDCLRISSYRDSTYPETEPQLIDMLRLPLEGRHVLLIDDILDTGRTLLKVAHEVRRLGPASLRTCVLLEKKARREVAYHADFVGFEIPDEFVVGYGLDYAERYRNLPCIGVLKPHLQNPPEWV